MSAAMRKKSETERTVLFIDGELVGAILGWFFGEVKYADKGAEFFPYRSFVNNINPDWKSYRCFGEYYSDGKWNRRTATCGEVR